MLTPATYEPMLAEATPAVPVGPGWRHERKYDGVRALAHADAGPVSLLTRKGQNKARQFPEVADALRALSALVGQKLVLDGEIVDADDDGFLGLQRLQRRLPLEQTFKIGLLAKTRPAAFVAFDVLAIGAVTLLDRTLAERRQLLEAVLSDPPAGVRLALQESDGAAMLARAQAEDWEGLVSKRADSRYFPGQRSALWRKLKIVRRQEFVVGGFTESDAEQREFRALVVGYHDDAGRLAYAGRVGTGFSERELGSLARRLRSLARLGSPFDPPPVLDEPTRWVEPRMVVEVRFQDWTETARLRSPSFLTVREDKRPEEVVREP
ncbi:MAG TPA: non-homologous end-joining DNA ligase [Longimicrobium sp.]|jgi:bifunctional non-homologous end joining protein LigD